MRKIISSLRIFLFMTILTGIIYPILVTGMALLLFPKKANGSMVLKNGIPIGSLLIGQEFTDPRYFTSRPSSNSYNPLPSGGSNLALTNHKLKDLVSSRKKEFLIFNDLDTIQDLPSEMLFSSSSGLDPHISPEAALLQAERIVRTRNFSLSQRKAVTDLIKILTEEPQFHMLGKKRINVFLLNLSLDTIK